MEFDAIHDFFDHVDADRPLLAGLLQAVEDFKAIEGFSSSVFFDDQWEGILCPLAGRESFMAAETLSPSSDGVFIFSQSRINHFTLGMATERTFHTI